MNNIFSYATKELSQDAFLCWSINWLTQGNDKPLYQYGKAMLDMFLGEKKQEHYQNVEVRGQYEKIDVLVLFDGTDSKRHALIIEDKTNTSEHSNQMQRYKEKIQQKNLANEIHLAYIKTGIMYDEDARMVGKGAVVVDLDVLLAVVAQYAEQNTSEILSCFNAHIQSIKDHRVNIEQQIDCGEYSTALQDSYGQFYFLNKVFSGRSMANVLGTQYVTHKSNCLIYIDEIYSGANRNGSPWSQYCLWGKKYPTNHVDANTNEYHYLFWRIDQQASGYYLALRHYDALAHSKTDEYLNARKKYVYKKFRARADVECEKHEKLFSKIGNRENYKESDLLFIPVENLRGMKFDEIKTLLVGITHTFSEGWEELYDGMAEALKNK